MGIDGIGNGGRIPSPGTPGAPGAGGAGGASGPSGATGPSRATETGRTFDVHGKESAEARAAQQTQATERPERTALERLRAGEVDVNGYVDLKVDAATKNLSGLPRVELEKIRDTLKHQMAHDPAVMDLVKQATGAVPSSEAKPEAE